MPVPPCVHPLIGGHGEHDDLVELAHGQAGHPDTVEEAHGEHHDHPGAAEAGLLHAGHHGGVRGVVAGRGQVGVATPGREQGQAGQEEQVAWEGVRSLSWSIRESVSNSSTLLSFLLSQLPSLSYCPSLLRTNHFFFFSSIHAFSFCSRIVSVLASSAIVPSH